MTRDDRRFGDHTIDDLAAIAREEIPADAEPGYAAVSGSHLYGWATTASDVDLRGFHVADGRQYALLDPPTEQVAATFTNARRSTADVDFVSRELRTFGRLVADRNVNALETLSTGFVVLDAHPSSLDRLRDHVHEALPLDVPARYAGMARSNRDAVTEGGSVKRTLYALRALLAAHHVADEARLESDIRRLSTSVLGETALVADLVDAKREAAGEGSDGARGSETDDARLDAELASRTAAVLDDLQRRDWPDDIENGAYRRGVDDWMRDVRGWENRTGKS